MLNVGLHSLAPANTCWIFIFLRPNQLLLVHISVCVFPLEKCPLRSVMQHGVIIERMNCCDKLLWLVLFYISDIQLKDNPAFSMLNDSDDEVIYRFVARHSVVYSEWIIISLSRWCFSYCKGVIMKICLYKTDEQSKLQPSTRTTATATDEIYENTV